MHRTLDRIAHDREIGGAKRPRQGRDAPREAERDEAPGSPLPLDGHRPVVLAHVCVHAVHGKEDELPRALHLRVADGRGAVGRHEVDRFAPSQGEGCVRRRQRTGVRTRLPHDGSVAPARRHDELLTLDASDREQYERVAPPESTAWIRSSDRTRAKPAKSPRLPCAARIDTHDRAAAVDTTERIARGDRHRAWQDRHLDDG